MSDGKRGMGESGGETPSLADHSGNNTPAGTRKTKVRATFSKLSSNDDL